MMKKIVNRIVVAGLSGFILFCAYVPMASAEACTYKDGLLAYEQNNRVRAETLLTMAMRDGDKRAELFLAKHFASKEPSLLVALK